MQHRYVPDLGDFSKFAVIDSLSAQGTDRTALIWYLVNPHEIDEAHNNDGKHTTYLDDDRLDYADCHPELYKRFQAIHATGEKHVGVYSRHNVLPNMGYFPEPLTYDGQALTQREAWRSSWLERAMQTAADADLVVLDPDNGLMSDRLSIRSKSAIKYASLDECAAFYAGGKRSLVVYKHAHRQVAAQEQASRALHRLSEHLGVDRANTFALRFHRGTTRFYLVVSAQHQQRIMRERANSIINSDWGKRGHFSLID